MPDVHRTENNRIKFYHESVQSLRDTRRSSQRRFKFKELTKAARHPSLKHFTGLAKVAAAAETPAPAREEAARTSAVAAVGDVEYRYREDAAAAASSR